MGSQHLRLSEMYGPLHLLRHATEVRILPLHSGPRQNTSQKYPAKTLPNPEIPCLEALPESMLFIMPILAEAPKAPDLGEPPGEWYEGTCFPRDTP